MLIHKQEVKMDIFRDQLAKIVYEQRNLLASYTKEYQQHYGSDDGEHLICCRNNDKDIYYRANKVNGKYARKSIGKDKAVIYSLARKEYLRTSMDALRKNVAILDSAVRDTEGLGLDSLQSKMTMAYRKLPEECFFANAAGRSCNLSADNERRFRRHRDWANEAYKKSDYMPEHRRFMTSGGFRVRSKSEQLIAEQLLSCGVPFRYEQVIDIDGLSYSADFTFRDRDMELFYWEHAGMMDDPRYVNSHCSKMDSFKGIGVVPWKNLIITYDVDGAINIPMIKSIIENEVIPRM